MECKRIVSLGLINMYPVLGTCGTWRLLHNVHQSNRIETTVRCISGSRGTSDMAETSGTQPYDPDYTSQQKQIPCSHEKCVIFQIVDHWCGPVGLLIRSE